MPEQTPEDLVAPILEAWERGDFSARPDFFAPDLLVTGFDPDGTHRARGAEETGAYLRRFFTQFRDYRIVAGQLEPLSDEVLLMEGRQLGTGRLSGLEIEESLFIVFRFSGSQLIEMHWHPRREGALEAAGLEDHPH